MTEIGTWLKQARESQGLTVEQVSLVTKVRSGLLVDLEANRLHKLPERVFVRGFVQAYAEAVRMPTGEALGLLEQHYGIAEGRAAEVYSAAHPVPEFSKNSRAKIGVALVILLAVLTFSVAWAVQNSGSPRKAASAAKTTDVDSGTAGSLADPHNR
ncbi:MAG: helix-turn-helix domain-containing protein [Pseudomonadota bacterium]